jgi:hypothetical protein
MTVACHIMSPIATLRGDTYDLGQSYGLLASEAAGRGRELARRRAA